MNDRTLAAVGENSALKQIFARLTELKNTLVGPGDDAAVVELSTKNLAVTTDSMIEGYDFYRVWSTGFELGSKAAATNLSDLVAMGAKPQVCVVAVSCPADLELDYLLDFASGFTDFCKQSFPECGIVGGDLTRSETFTITVTAIGSQELAPVVRSGARPGDRIVVAGELGWAATGLELLFQNSYNSETKQATSASELKALELGRDFLTAQLSPNPPLNQALAAASQLNSMLDLSDGLVKDSYRISRASSVGLKLYPEALAAAAAKLPLEQLGITKEKLELVLFGGEDHSLLATVSAEAEIPAGFTLIGEVITGSGVWLEDKLLSEQGWDSFTSW